MNKKNGHHFNWDLCYIEQGTQRENRSKPLKHSSVKRILAFKR